MIYITYYRYDLLYKSSNYTNITDASLADEIKTKASDLQLSFNRLIEDSIQWKDYIKVLNSAYISLSLSLSLHTYPHHNLFTEYW